MQWAGTNKMRTTNARITPPRPTTEPLTYCKVFCPVIFQDKNPTFSPAALSMGGAGPSPTVSGGAAQLTTELTENATSAPKSATTTAIEGRNSILNLTLTTGLGDQELPAYTDSDVTLADSSIANNDNSTYLESRKNSTTIENTTPDLLAIIEETGNILEVFSEGLGDLNTPG